MNWNRFFLTGYTCFVITMGAAAQADGDLKQDKDGIKVFTKKIDDSPLKAVKVVCTLNTSLSTLTAVLLDIKGSIDWVYETRKVSLLKPLSPAELIYYSEVQVPWPVSNRDFIILLTVSQNAKTKVVTVVGHNKPDYLPEVKNIVRIKKSYSKWQITPLTKGQVKVEYDLQVDPGGNVPAWLINLFAAKGPYETFKRLREQVKKPAYSHVTLPFIKD